MSQGLVFNVPLNALAITIDDQPLHPVIPVTALNSVDTNFFVTTDLDTNTPTVCYLLPIKKSITYINTTDGLQYVATGELVDFTGGHPQHPPTK